MKQAADWGYTMNDDDMNRMLVALTKAYKDTYMDDKEWDWHEVADEVVERGPKVNHANLLREVMHELHKQGDGLDTLLALKNDELRDWWSSELAKIKRAEAKSAARERAKSLLSKEERELLGMKF